MLRVIFIVFSTSVYLHCVHIAIHDPIFSIYKLYLGGLFDSLNDEKPHEMCFFFFFLIAFKPHVEVMSDVIAIIFTQMHRDLNSLVFHLGFKFALGSTLRFSTVAEPVPHRPVHFGGTFQGSEQNHQSCSKPRPSLGDQAASV